MNENLRKNALTAVVTTMLAALILTVAAGRPGDPHAWSKEELAELQSLWIGNLPAPEDPSNAYLGDDRAAELGRRIFFDTSFSGDGSVACATCHQPARNFMDGRALSQGIGTTDRKSMSTVGVAHDDWFFWDGRVDSMWAQALGPLENPAEHGFDRTSVARVIAAEYREEYEEIFGPVPDVADLPPAAPLPGSELNSAWQALSERQREEITRVFVNVGKAVAAFESRLTPGEARFDLYVQALVAGDARRAGELLSADEAAGGRLFIGEAGCTSCHSGPTLSNGDFHNTGVPLGSGRARDLGRAEGATAVMASEFNCLSAYSDADPRACTALRFLKAEGHELERAFKVPTLRNLAVSGPFMHAGQFATIREVLEHYDRAPVAPAGHSELQPLRLSERQLRQLEAFLLTLSAPVEYDGQEWTDELADPGLTARVPR